MPVNRVLWKQSISKDSVPAWLCPACSNGYFQIHSNSLTFLETKASRKARELENSNPNEREYRFSALLRCNNDGCQEPAMIAGSGGVDIGPVDPTTENFDIVEFFYPEYFNPSPQIITVPINCPDPVKKELQKAFSSSWGDCPAAVNHIRTSVERLLDYLRERKTRINKKGRHERLTLHERIKNRASRNKTLSDKLMAIKWLGNVGSHTEDISRDDVFDALDILETVLDDMFVKHRERIKKLTTAINRKKGPAKK